MILYLGTAFMAGVLVGIGGTVYTLASRGVYVPDPEYRK